MHRCTRKGCGQEYDSAENTIESCIYHPGGPVFHEGLKSWSCCSDVNKPVLDFDEFMKIQGCTRGNHTDEAPAVDTPKPTSNANLKMTASATGTEEYFTRATAQSVSKPPPAPLVIEEDDLDTPVAVGTTCKHNGCGITFVSDEVNRKGDSEGTVCVYHPAPPIFHEGSKGYMCCKRRVLEFDEFLKMKGCKTGRHLFALKSKQEEQVNCRVDHYQTLKEVHVSVFAKAVDKEQSKVVFEDTKVILDLYLPASKRFRRTLDLFGPIDPNASTHKFYGTKVEVVLKKADTRSWTVLEKTSQDLGNISLTFGVGGRTGTIGAVAKEAVLDESNRARA